MDHKEMWWEVKNKCIEAIAILHRDSDFMHDHEEQTRLHGKIEGFRTVLTWMEEREKMFDLPKESENV